MSPAPAVTQPHANRLSVSHPVDMHAHAIITAPMTNTKNEPVPSLRIQGIVSSNSRSACLVSTDDSELEPTYCWNCGIDASCAGRVIVHCTDTLRSAGSSNFFRPTPSLPLIERKIRRAKYQKTPMQIRKMINASTGLRFTRVRPPSTAASSPRLSPIFVNGSGEVLLASRVAALAVCARRLVPPANNATMTVNAGLG